jgi:hypothetical protein
MILNRQGIMRLLDTTRFMGGDTEIMISFICVYVAGSDAWYWPLYAWLLVFQVVDSIRYTDEEYN